MQKIYLFRQLAKNKNKITLYNIKWFKRVVKLDYQRQPDKHTDDILKTRYVVVQPNDVYTDGGANIQRLEKESLIAEDILICALKDKL